MGPKKVAAKPKAPASHPPYIAMVKAAIAALKERNGSSRQAIIKYVMANYKVGNDQKPVNSRVKMALRRGTAKGALKHVGKGAGANGSFKVAEKAAKAKKAAAAKPKKAKSPKKKPAAKKPAAKKTPAAAKKTVKKATAAKPQKAKAAPKKVAPKKKSGEETGEENRQTEEEGRQEVKERI